MFTTKDFSKSRMQLMESRKPKLTTNDREDLDKIKRWLHIMSVIHMMPAGTDDMISQAFATYEKYVR